MFRPSSFIIHHSSISIIYSLATASEAIAFHMLAGCDEVSTCFFLGTDGVDFDKDVWKITVSGMFETIGAGFQLQRTKTPQTLCLGRF